MTERMWDPSASEQWAEGLKVFRDVTLALSLGEW